MRNSRELAGYIAMVLLLEGDVLVTCVCALIGRGGVVAFSLALIPSLWKGEDGGSTCIFKWLW
jgi:hypothetical protein